MEMWKNGRESVVVESFPRLKCFCVQKESEIFVLAKGWF